MFELYNYIENIKIAIITIKKKLKYSVFLEIPKTTIYDQTLKNLYLLKI